MTATLTVEPRRRGSSSANPPRELPVLFHLMDVSRSNSQPPKPQAAAPEAHPVTAERETPPPAADSSPSEAFHLEADQPEVAQPEPIQQAASEPLPAPEAPAARAELEAPHAESPALVEPLVCDQAPEVPEVMERSTSIAEAVAMAASETALTPPAEVAPRQHEPRQARLRPPARNDWFTIHGKYIAIGFVLALLGTIYLARISRRTVAPIADSQQHAHPGEAGNQLSSESKVATVVGESKDGDKPTSVSGAAESSPAKLVEAPAAKPQTDLHPPSLPQLVTEPAASEPPADNGLFPWAERPEDRMAARPGAPHLPQAQNSGPQYPITEPRAALPPNYPAGPQFAPQPGAAPPVTAYQGPPGPATPGGGSFVPPDAQGAFASGQGAVYQSPAPEMGQQPPPYGPQYTPQDNTARGYRYERTGSGPY